MGRPVPERAGEAAPSAVAPAGGRVAWAGHLVLPRRLRDADRRHASLLATRLALAPVRLA